ncbi:hypothetical protein WJX75_003039 [Coccomyxa subellipsoidea]|uniref:Uncharacterized protein n=1 Tax=Coccomyxa subellipsoidea TaxID=248742 RepID=A0ABR2YV78_9CHLO
MMRAEFKDSQQNVTEQFARSLEFAHGNIKDLQKAIEDLQKQQKEASAQAAVLAAQEPVPDAVVLAGLDEATEAETETRISELFSKELQLEMLPRIKSVTRLGAARPDADAKLRKVLVEFETGKDVTTVLRAPRNLRNYNAEAKAAGRLPVGIERSLTEAQRKHKSSIWSCLKAARDDGKRSWWRGHRLFVEVHTPSFSPPRKSTLT